jgi:hypothetical protein
MAFQASDCVGYPHSRIITPLFSGLLALLPNE